MTGAQGLANNLVAAGATLAGLTLVFLGSALNAYDRYSAEERAAVQSKYRFRARIALSAFVLSVLGGGAAIVASFQTTDWWLLAAVVLVGSAALLLFVMAFVAVRDI